LSGRTLKRELQLAVPRSSHPCLVPDQKIQKFPPCQNFLEGDNQASINMKSNLYPRLVFNFFLAAMLLAAPLSRAAIIGTNPPASPVTLARVAALPSVQQPAWQDYLERSTRRMAADQNFLRMEMKAHGLTSVTVPPSATNEKGLSLTESAAWYGGTEGRRIADIAVSFQTPAGGWSKNLNFTKLPRAPGEHFAGDNNSLFLTAADNDAPHDAGWSYVGTFDNGATVAQLRYLAEVVTAVGTNDASAYRSSFLHGLDYIFSAQYPNGGWPQVWPLQGGYHDAVTYNDDAMLNVLKLLRDVAAGKNEFTFVPDAARAQANASFKRGMDCLLASQIVVDGRRTAWGQQHDALTLQPESARNYEMPSQASGESGTIVLFLMELPNPDTNIIVAARAAAAWFEKTKLNDVVFKSTGSDGRELIPTPGSGPLWARYIEIGSDRPLFGDRDKMIHDDVAEISKERRNGYAWFKDTPKRVLEHYPRWLKTNSPAD
jgi:PelA/Pel-15E family pectate lyase